MAAARAAAAEATDDAAHRRDLDRAERLAEHHEPDQRRDRRLERQQMLNVAALTSCSAKSSSRYGIADASAATASPTASTWPSHSAVPDVASAGPASTTAATASVNVSSRQRRRPADEPLGEHDVRRPARRRAEREDCAERVDVRARAAEQRDAEPGEHREPDVARPPRAGDRHEQRPGELDRRRDAERHPRDRLEEAGVHGREHDAERDDAAAARPRQRERAAAEDREQQQRGERAAQPQDAERPDAPEQAGRDRRAEVHRDGEGDDEQRRGAAGDRRRARPHATRRGAPGAARRGRRDDRGAHAVSPAGAWIARTVSTVSASAAVLSGRWRLTRAKRSAMPPG
jgi:hypothetical protein